jgi:hypothetical protein
MNMNGCYLQVVSTSSPVYVCAAHQSPFGQNGGDNGSPAEGTYGRQLSLLSPQGGWVDTHPITQAYLKQLAASNNLQRQFFISMYT